MQNGASSTFITAPDGLRLHAQCYGQRSSAATPVVCLPGLARTAADFEALASALTHESLPPRRVIALNSADADDPVTTVTPPTIRFRSNSPMSWLSSRHSKPCRRFLSAPRAVES